jgi:hypothetical protein
MDSLTIAIPPSLRDFVEQRAAVGGVSVDEFVTSLVVDALLKQQKHQIRDMVLEALQEEAVPLDAAEWASIRAEARAVLEAKARQ